MIEVTSIMSEPGYWAMAFLMMCALITLTSALYLRPKRTRFLEVVNEIVAEGRLTRADKAWLRSEIDRSKGVHLLIASPFAPFAIVAALVVAIFDGWNEGDNDISHEALQRKLDRLDRNIEATEAEVVELSEGVDPRKGNYWNDSRREEMRKLIYTIETWNNPLSMAWILAWMILASPLVLVAYFVSGSLKPFIVNIWEPLRNPVRSALLTIRPTLKTFG